MGRLDNKSAIITGAAQGTGAAIARRFVEEGARVCLLDVNEEALADMAAELGDAAMSLRADVSCAADWEAAVELTQTHFGGVNVLVNNAALLDISLLEDLQENVFTRLFHVNQLGPALGIQAVLPAMKKGGYGSIVNIGSTDGVVAQDIGLVAYGSTKFALRGITRMAALELGRYAIRVNCVNPDSGNIEMSRPFLPPDLDADDAMRQHVEQNLTPPPWASGFNRFNEIAAMVCFLASDESSGCTGGDFPVDGGYVAGRRFRD